MYILYEGSSWYLRSVSFFATSWCLEPEWPLKFQEWWYRHFLIRTWFDGLASFSPFGKFLHQFGWTKNQENPTEERRFQLQDHRWHLASVNHLLGSHGDCVEMWELNFSVENSWNPWWNYLQYHEEWSHVQWSSKSATLIFFLQVFSKARFGVNKCHIRSERLQ